MTHGPGPSREKEQLNGRLSSNLLGSTIMAVCTRFDPQPNGVRFFSDAERDEAYLLARPFLLEQMRILLEDGWKRTNDWNSEEVYPSFTNLLRNSTHYLIIYILISTYSIYTSH